MSNSHCTCGLSNHDNANCPTLGRPASKEAELEVALRGLLLFVTSGRRYQQQNPYTIDEVKAAMKALGESL